MKAELPELNQCCCCLPLRPGLLAWGYLKLVLLMLLMTNAILEMVGFAYPGTRTILFSSLYLLTITPDVCLTVIYLIGAHRNAPKMLFISYIGNIAIFCVEVLLFTSAATYSLYRQFGTNSITDGLSFVEKLAALSTFVQMELGMGIFYLGTVMYVIILLKSVMNKLNSPKCRFEINAVEEGNGTIEQGVTIKETNLE